MLVIDCVRDCLSSLHLSISLSISLPHSVYSLYLLETVNISSWISKTHPRIHWRTLAHICWFIFLFLFLFILSPCFSSHFAIPAPAPVHLHIHSIHFLIFWREIQYINTYNIIVKHSLIWSRLCSELWSLLMSPEMERQQKISHKIHKHSRSELSRNVLPFLPVFFPISISSFLPRTGLTTSW